MSMKKRWLQSVKKKTTRSTNDFFKFIEDVEKRPDEYSDKIVKQVALQRKMLKKYDFIEEKGKKCVGWIEILQFFGLIRPSQC